jgi:hypothetical protein
LPPPDPSSSTLRGGRSHDSMSARAKESASCRYSAGVEKMGHHSASSPYSFIEMSIQHLTAQRLQLSPSRLQTQGARSAARDDFGETRAIDLDAEATR